ncbi:hypothetical protein [Embleya sp. NBC_00896]|uniref:hypothetical protein n=1 Tax=Embleya sp. NBC_00896 TaxID=2975961 RepID=UPI00386354E1|nr:hypothetical protein OG928_25015 [Embleya sp. NBC_00896]
MAVAVGAVVLVGCGGDEGAPEVGRTGSSVPVVPSVGGTAESTGGAPTSASAEPVGDCGPAPSLAPGHRIVQPIRQPNKDQLYFKKTRFVCDANGGHYEAVGEEQTPLVFVVEVDATLSGPTPWKARYLGQVWVHIGKCLAGGQDGEHMCSPFPVYEITVDDKKQITSITEIFHP